MLCHILFSLAEVHDRDKPHSSVILVSWRLSDQVLYSYPHLCSTQSTLNYSEHLQWSRLIWSNFNICRPQRKLKHFYLSFEHFLIGFWKWQPIDGIPDLEEKSVSGSLYGTGNKWIPEYKNRKLMVICCLMLVTFKFHV